MRDKEEDRERKRKKVLMKEWRKEKKWKKRYVYKETEYENKDLFYQYIIAGYSMGINIESK